MQGSLAYAVSSHSLSRHFFLFSLPPVWSCLIYTPETLPPEIKKKRKNRLSPLIGFAFHKETNKRSKSLWTEEEKKTNKTEKEMQ